MIDYQKIIDLNNSAFQDYLSARILINNRILIQGSCMAATALEKIIKSILLLNNINHLDHLNKSIIKKLRNHCPQTFDLINEDIITYFSKCYLLRYTDNIQNGFNRVIAERELLYIIDNIFMKTIKNFSYVKEDKNLNARHIFELNLRIKNRDKPLLERNSYFQEIEKEDFIYSESQKIHEIRKSNAGYIVEVEYISRSRPSDSNINRQALIQNSQSKLGYELSHSPENSQNISEELFRPPAPLQ